MKKVELVIDASQLEAVRAVLARVGVEGMTVFEARSYGSGGGRTEVYRGARHEVYLVDNLKVEILADDGRVPALVEELARVPRDGSPGDGRIVVTPIETIAEARASARAGRAS